MAEIQIKINCDVDTSGLLKEIEAMADYINNASPDDPFAILAGRIGVLNVEECIQTDVEYSNGMLTATFTASGDLVTLLDAWRAMS